MSWIYLLLLAVLLLGVLAMILTLRSAQPPLGVIRSALHIKPPQR